MGKFLDKIKSPHDIKKLNISELNSLCVEIRSFLVDSVSQTGGHLASNLGVVELTVAILSVFDMDTDKIVFDVGHQSYVYKMLTGRMDKFCTLRKFNGLSGFPKSSESKYDFFNTGHSSTSISAALGLARARDLNGTSENVLALFGDGALTGGMMYEAMNDAGHSKTPLILILNDNNMSIAKNVGSVSRHLQKLRLSPAYFKSKEATEKFLDKVPHLGTPVSNGLRRAKRTMRKIVNPTSMFDDLGFTYLGPVDGHNIEALISCLEYAKAQKKPVIIHALTKKGKGYFHAENNPEKFHGIAPFDKISGSTGAHVKTYSDCFGEALLSLAKDNEKIVAITGAMPSGTGLIKFSKMYKDRFFDVGIAEQHGVTMAAGMATGGYIPVIPLYSSFLQRAYDQALHDVCLQNLHVVFPIDRAGIVGADGETHQGVYDISYLCHMPNMTVLSPSTFKELNEMLDFAINRHNGPVAIRYPRGSTELNTENVKFEFGKAQIIKQGTDISIIATGRMAVTAMAVSERLAKNGISAEVMLIPTIKPLDNASVIATALKTKRVITIEDNVKIGGMGQMIADVYAEHNVSCSLKIYALPDMPITHGTVAELDKLYGVDENTIFNEVTNAKNKA